MPEPTVVHRLGQFLGEEMEERGWTSFDVAARMGSDMAVDALFVDMVLVIDRPNAVISVHDYRRLEKAFGVSEGFFERLDADWRKQPDRLAPYSPPDHILAGTAS
ncbi:MAG: hypothetical protein E6R03_17870 [Hyphomicrobiaceae bacterium]|nr:MAG: hypothetical protein E6R03_17870 [Hyphomicrobiaceae bacterium]